MLTMMYKRFKFLGIMFLIALAVIAIPASAEGNYKTITTGTQYVFIGEEGLDITSVMAGYDTNTIYWFAPGSSMSDAPYAKTITVAEMSNFYVSNSEFSSRLGTWYTKKSGEYAAVFIVEKPSISFRIWNIVTDSDATDESVSRTAKIDFKIDTNLYHIFARNTNATDFDFDIKVTNPEGATYSSLGINKSIQNILVDAPLYYWADQDAVKAWDISDKSYKSGEYKVKIECQENGLDVISLEKVFRIATDSVKLNIPDDEVVRGGQFVVEIQGSPKADYLLFVKSGDATTAPKIMNSQDGVVKNTDYNATVTLDSSGKRVVGFTTNDQTKDKTWTIRVELIGDTNKYDEETIAVREGEVSIGIDPVDKTTFYLGDEIELVGKNDETETVFFFITGPNLPVSGGRLDDPRTPVINGDEGTFVKTDVDENDEFEYTWDTTGLSIDAGTYTVYAVSGSRDKSHLSDGQYDTVSVVIRKPNLAAEIDRSIVAAGDEFKITGNAAVQTDEGIAIWIMGKNFYLRDVVDIEDDGTFEYEVDRSLTESLSNGQYYVVVQHPMYNGEFDVFEYQKSGDSRIYIAVVLVHYRVLMQQLH